jgi:TPP-dependent indolepyruvate ferredoxin oxidoreductase alpha subunit
LIDLVTFILSRPRIVEDLEKVPFNRIKAQGGEDVGIVVAGIGYSYAKEALRLLNLKEGTVVILKLGVSHSTSQKSSSKVPEVL